MICVDLRGRGESEWAAPNTYTIPHYVDDAVKLLDAGVATREDIDTAMKGGCNFPMGPLELLDLVGLDTSLAILDALYAEFRDPNFAPAPLLRRMVAADRLGRKSGAGFYDYRR